MREVIARSDIQPILTEGRAVIERDTQDIIQGILDEYESGVLITQVQTQKADPPDQVIDAFRDVQAARADMKKKLLRKQRVKQVDFYQFILSTLKQRKLLRKECI